MKKTTFASFVMVLSFSAFLRADTEVEWAKVRRASLGKPLLVTTTAGETIQGYCTSINVDEIALQKTDRQIVKVAKNTISQLRVHRVNNHRLLSLFKGMGQGFKDGAGMLFSPLAPVGLIELPAIVAWGAVSIPFCLLGDGANLLAQDYAIKIK